MQPTSDFHLGARDSSAGPHACQASPLSGRVTSPAPRGDYDWEGGSCCGRKACREEKDDIKASLVPLLSGSLLIPVAVSTFP